MQLRGWEYTDDPNEPGSLLHEDIEMDIEMDDQIVQIRLPDGSLLGFRLLDFLSAVGAAATARTITS